MESDAALLHAYAQERSEAAFRLLVERHLPVVYSAALRRLSGDSHRAQDVAQVAFALLAHRAAELQSHPVITGWLYSTTQKLAMKAVRDEQRRVAREQFAVDETGAGAGWEQLRPVIDDALLHLRQRDRDAVLLRYFQNKPFAEIGAQLGLNENAARMRVERALDALQVVLAKRGITSAAGAVGLVLSSHAATAVPGALAATIAGGVSAAGAASAGFFLMSTSMIKAGLAGAVVTVGAVGLYLEHRAADRLRAELDSARAVLRMARTSVARDANAAARDQTELQRLRAEVAGLRSKASGVRAAAPAANASLRERVMQPGQAIPELRFLSEADWIEVSKGPLETEDDYRYAMAAARNLAGRKFGTMMNVAIKAYAQANAGRFPADPAELGPYFPEPIEPAIFQRYEVLPASAIPKIKMGGDFVVVEKAPIDEEYDFRSVIGPAGWGAYDWFGAKKGEVFNGLVKSWVDANPGKQPKDATEFEPYATTPEQRAILQRFLQDEARRAKK